MFSRKYVSSFSFPTILFEQMRKIEYGYMEILFEKVNIKIKSLVEKLYCRLSRNNIQISIFLIRYKNMEKIDFFK